PPVGRAKPVVPVKAGPGGPPATLTASPRGLAAKPGFRGDRFVWLAATHHGDVGLEASPQALTRFGSVLGATPGWSDTKGVTVYALRGAALSGEAATTATPNTIASASSMRRPFTERCSPISHAPLLGSEFPSSLPSERQIGFRAGRVWRNTA